MKHFPLLEVVVLVEVHAFLRVGADIDLTIFQFLFALMLVRLEDAFFFVHL